MRLIYINSANRIKRDGSTDSDFEIEVGQNVKEKYAVLLRACIPKTYPTIPAGNKLVLIEGTDEVIVSLKVGSCNVRSFAIELESRLTELSPHHYTYHISADELERYKTIDSGKYTFRVGNIPNGSPKPKFRTNDTLYEQMGLNRNSKYVFEVDNTFTAPNVYNMNKENTIFIHSNLCAKSEYDVLQEIFTTSNISNSFITFENLMVAHYSKEVAINGRLLSFRITDEFGRILDLQGVNVNFTICLSDEPH